MKLRIFSLLAAVLAAAAAIAAPRTVALIVQNHCSGGVEPPLLQLADLLVPALTSPDLSIGIADNFIGRYQNVKPSGEKMPEASAKALAEDLGTDGLLIASVQQFSALTMQDIGSTNHRISVMMTLTLYNLSTGCSVCSTLLDDNWSKTIPDKDMKINATFRYEKYLFEAARDVARRFLAKYDPGKWNPVPAKKVKVFFGCNVLGADVKIDGQSYGTCPMELETTVGSHNLEVSYPPYYFGFKRLAKFETDGQAYKVVLPLNELGEEQRNRALEYEAKLVELKKSQLELEKMKDGNRIEYEKKKIALEREKKSIEAEQGERCELFKKQLALADAMLERYSLSGEADDYVRKTIADGTAVYWKNSFGRIAITEGSADNIEFATPSTDAGDLAVPPNPREIGEGLQKFLMKRIGR